MPDDLKERVRRLSEKQVCPICKRTFIWLSRDIRYTFEIPFLPSRHIEICPRCVQRAILGGSTKTSRKTTLGKFKQIAELLDAIPDRTGFVYDQAPTLDVAVQITRLMHTIPRFQELAKSSGSWFKLLIEAGVLPDGTRRTFFGTMVVARDGHECLSLAEKSIDDLLYEYGIPHEKEPHYPDSAFRADWKITVLGRPVFIEFFGLDGQPRYTRRMREKEKLAAEKGIVLVAFTPKDLPHLRDAFRRKLLPLLEGQ